MIRLPEKFIQRMSQTLSGDLEDFLASYDKPPVRGVRANLLKTSPEELKSLLAYKIERSKILEEGFVLNESPDGMGNDPYHIAGLFYIQEPSAMAPIAAAEINPGMRVLDLCAAPGGKSGGIAARMHGEGLLVANEIVSSRAKILGFTLERLGVTNAAVTCAHAVRAQAKIERHALCARVRQPRGHDVLKGKSGAAALQGAIAEWSEEHVISCAQRQRAILKSAYKALRPGGKLIYSTCTFSREENEDNVDWLASEFPDMEIELTQRLYPHTCQGEGHFVARLKKAGDDRMPQPDMKLLPCREKDYFGFIEHTFDQPPKGKAYMLKDGRVLLIDGELPAGLSAVRLLSAGVYAGDMLKGRFVPAYSLFMAAHGGKYRNTIDLTTDDPRLDAFLRGNTIGISGGLKGYMPLCVGGFPVGFGKAVEGTLKNHIPKGLRRV